MKYQTPELLLVGAAQNLVLGLSEDKFVPERLNFDDGFESYGGPIPDGTSW